MSLYNTISMWHLGLVWTLYPCAYYVRVLCVVILQHEIKEKQLMKALKENQCEQMAQFCHSMDDCVRFLEESHKQVTGW